MFPNSVNLGSAAGPGPGATSKGLHAHHHNHHRSAVVIIRGEICVLIASLRRATRWASHNQESKSDIILRKLQALRESLDSSCKTSGIKISGDANYFLVPFLDVIRSPETSGPVTALALSSIEKFISYGIINEANGSGGAVEAITDAVIHAHFVSTDSASDELVLMKILNVLHRLFLSQLGPLLSNESVCELMQACFRMCLIERANELLRKSAETALTDMICSLFSRLHTFSTIESKKVNGKSLVRTPHIVFEAPTPPPQTPQNKIQDKGDESQSELKTDEQSAAEAIGNAIPSPILPIEDENSIKTEFLTPEGPSNCESQSSKSPDILPSIQIQEPTPDKIGETIISPAPPPSSGEFKNSSGVRFTSDSQQLSTTAISGEEEWTKPTITSNSPRGKITVPYGIPCVRELFRFLNSLINPYVKTNTELMIHLGLKLLLVAVETGVDGLAKHSSILSQTKNELCKNLIALLAHQSTGPGTVVVASSSILLNVFRILFILFENLRYHLKYQLELFLGKVGELINESSSVVGGVPASQLQGKWNYEHREIALDFLTQLWKLPCFVTELYLNYDCDLFCSNLFEDTTKLLSKNAFPMQNAINSSHLLCLDGLVSILDGIENHCTLRISTNPNPNATNQSNSTTGSDESNSSVFYHEETSTTPNTKIKTKIFDDDENEGSLDEVDRLFNHQNNNISSDSDDFVLPTHEQLMAIRHKKKIIHTGSEHFNASASKGIQFLQTHGILAAPLDPNEVAHFLRDNPLLDKRAIGDYISNRKHSEILHAFVCSFDFARLRVDEALRIFLETFRLPGEAGPIALILEEFAAHWSHVNGNPFANVDAAYILAYQVIMLNVDQHNSNVKKQGTSMTIDNLKSNLKGCNGGKDFDPEMLKEIYVAIKSEEIVMPAEQVGVVKDNYLWKVLLRRGSTPNAKFRSPAGNDEGVFDHDLFSLSWGPIVAALSFIFDKTNDSGIISKTLNGFRKCATISAHYGMSDVFDNLIISLCKFTTLISSNPDLNSGIKAQASCRLVFQLVHRHGDILREGWKNFVDCLISLFKLQVLPKILTESDDFTDPSGRISLVRRSQISVPRQETGLFSSLYSYIALSADSPGSKSSIAEEEENKKKVQVLVIECRPELLLSESKFLQIESLQELIKALISASPVPETKRKELDEDQLAFVLEVLLKITIQNRDRALEFWEIVREHLFALIMSSAANDMPYILERATVGLLRVALRLMRKEDLCSIVLQSLRVLLYLKPASVVQLSQQLSFGVHEILKTTAANIHTKDEWSIIFTLLEYVGAGKVPPTLTAAVVASSSSTSTLPGQKSVSNDSSLQMHGHGPTSLPSPVNTLGSSGFPHQLQHSLSQDPIPHFNNSAPIGYSSGSDRGYTSDSELEIRGSGENGKLGNISPAQSWILISNKEDQQLSGPQSPAKRNPIHPNSPLPILLERQLFYPDPKSLVKSCETLSFLVRDAAHITPDNFILCVGAIRSFVEASTHKSRQTHLHSTTSHHQQGNKKRRNRKSNSNETVGLPKSKSFPSAAAYDADESDNEDQIAASPQVSIQLLDLLHTLHTRAAQIFQWWQKEMSVTGGGGGNSEEVASLWSLGWKPLLQAIVVLCSDSRKQVRTIALTYLQRALLVHDLQKLTPAEWLSCFHEVLFPLMIKLLEPLNTTDAMGMEETRMRASTLLCKVFLQHLTPLLQLDEFTTLWLQILEFLEKYLNHSDKSELLIEAIPESLKNLLLVMETAGIFHTPEGYTKLWAITWEKIDAFLPTLRAELIRSVPPVPSAEPPQPVQIIPSSPENNPNPIPSSPSFDRKPSPHHQQSESSPRISLLQNEPPIDFIPFVFSATPDSAPSKSNDIDNPSPINHSSFSEVQSNKSISQLQESTAGESNVTSPIGSPTSGRIGYTSISFDDEEDNK